MNKYSFENKQKILEYLCSSEFNNHHEYVDDVAVKLGIEVGEVEYTVIELERRGFLSTKKQ